MRIMAIVSRGFALSPRRALAAGLGTLLILFASAASARRQQEPPVVIFADVNFSGRAQALDPGDYDMDSIAIGNDRVSSVHVSPGYRVILFKDSRFSGQARVITADTADLGKFNDDTSSLRVERMSARNERDERDEEVVIYSDFNYKGRAQALGTGYYDRDALQIGNDKLSSLHVPRGCQVTLFADERFSGAAVVITSDVASLDRFNDAASSIRVQCR